MGLRIRRIVTKSGNLFSIEASMCADMSISCLPGTCKMNRKHRVAHLFVSHACFVFACFWFFWKPLLEEIKAKPNSEPTQGTNQRTKQNPNRLSESIKQDVNQLRVLITGDISKRLGGLDNGRISMQNKSQSTQRALALTCGHCPVRQNRLGGNEVWHRQEKIVGSVRLLFLQRGVIIGDHGCH